MINHLYIDNYRSFTNFEWKPGRFCLLLGDNGTGKSSVLDVLELLRNFVVSGNPTVDAFPASSLCAWDERLTQTFELGVSDIGGDYLYRLVIEHDQRRLRSRISHERLTFEHLTLYEYDNNQAHLYRDDGSLGHEFPFDWSKSVIATIQERSDNQKLIAFRNRLERLAVFSPDPLRMSGQSDEELERPDRRLHKLVSWLRHLAQEEMTGLSVVKADLCEVLDGVHDFRLEKTSSRTRELKFEMSFSDNPGPATSFSLPLDQLSEGQRSLVALYTILHASVERDATVCIDEPDNFVSLREIQPWLRALKTKAEETQSQCILVSHNPELINYLAAEYGTWFFREQNGPVRTKPFESQEGAIAPSEMIARGWA